MIDSQDIPPVADNELLARFILNSNEKRDDGNVNHKLFMPYKWTELSVNRHREASVDETWAIGFDIATQLSKVLYGLANIRSGKCYQGTLRVVPDPIFPNNPNHANIVGYPASKEDQMALAKVLAASIEGQWQAAPDRS
ncbi:MAG: hypothetical protein U0892_16335 [Pirellulales bacterium]